MQPRELQLIVARLSAAQPITDAFENEIRVPGTRRPWYSSQKSHISGWLSEYGQGGAYDRKRPGQDARHFYTHFQCAPGLLWLAEALGEDPDTLRHGVEVIRAAGPKGAAQCGAFRKVVPWERIETLLAARQTQ